MGKMISQFPVLPHKPGVYFFWRGKTLLYVGKAADLRARIASHRRAQPGEKSHALLREADRLTFEESESAIDALLKEAQFIKRHQPKYNILMRDNKNYFYVGVTKEKLPRVFVTHQPFGKQTTNNKWRITKFIGPFTNGHDLKTTLRLLRKIFPHCTCKKTHPRACQSSQLGLCPGYCCEKKFQVSSLKSRTEYDKNIQNIIAVLSGKRRWLRAKLKKEMREASRRQNYEKAARLRDQIAGIENIFGHRPFLVPSHGQKITHSIAWERVEKNIRALLKIRRRVSRVESYDISNIAGREATGSMVVFMDGVPAKSEYRKFKIKTVTGANDVAMLKEIIARRLQHKEWASPDLMLIDGGKAQLNGILKVQTFQVSGFRPKVSSSKFQAAALAKREEELYLPGKKRPLRLDSLPPDTAGFLQRVRDEAHRFARHYHHKLREISYRNEKFKS